MTWAMSMGEAEVRAWAELAAVPVDPAHVEGVTAAMRMLGAQAALLASPPLAPEIEPATVFRP